MREDGGRQVVLLLGSNEEAETHLAAAVAMLGDAFPIVRISSSHRSPAANRVEAATYSNQAVLIQSDLGRESLKLRLRAIEAALGRVRPAPDARICPIDIDAIGQIAAGELVVWDQKSANADYAQAPLAELRLA